jgi:hypothetical protein
MDELFFFFFSTVIEVKPCRYTNGVNMWKVFSLSPFSQVNLCHPEPLRSLPLFPSLGYLSLVRFHNGSTQTFLPGGYLARIILKEKRWLLGWMLNEKTLHRGLSMPTDNADFETENWAMVRTVRCVV